MSRDVDTVHRGMLGLLPPGWAWPRDEGSLLAAALRPMAEGLSELEALAEALIAEVDPRTATATLADYERVLGPAQCGQDAAYMAVPDRQLNAHTRWVARGGQRRQYFVDIAVRLGYSIDYAVHLPVPTIDDLADGAVEVTGFAPTVSGTGTPGATLTLAFEDPPPVVRIEEWRPFIMGFSHCADETWHIGPACNRFYWRVVVPGARATWFRAGSGRCGMDPHVQMSPAEDLECLLRQYAPAHTQLIFQYLPAS